VQVDVGAVEKPPRKRGPVIGIDLGLTTFATISNGRQTEKIEAPKPLKKNLKRLRRAQRVLSRRQKGSKRREQARRRVARIHRRVRNVRGDFLNKLTTRLARENQAVVVEDLHTKGMVRNRHLAKAVSDAGWGEFRRMLEYKVVLYGSRLVAVDRFFPSSKTCSGCGAVKAVLLLSDRQYACEECGALLDRDENAAKNIRRAGLARTYARGPGSSGSSRKAGTKLHRVEAGTTPRAGSRSLTK
jgi:putative transposase